jgi:hypothetical protein
VLADEDAQVGGCGRLGSSRCAPFEQMALADELAI